jgi:hypothetical protein
MRRWFARLAACGLLALSVAGCHTAGVCDCADYNHDPCYGCMGGGTIGMHHAAAAPATAPTPTQLPTTPMTKVTD